MQDSTLTPPTTRGAGDKAYAIAKAALGSIPVAGAAATELFTLVVSAPLEKRRDAWMSSVAEELRHLEEAVAGFQLENLQKNEAFITAVMHASTIAMRSHQVEKLDALRNAVVNAAGGFRPDDDEMLLFLQWIDELSVPSIRMLKFFRNPVEEACAHGLNPNEVEGWPHSQALLFAAYPDLREEARHDGTMYKLWTAQLHDRSLLTGYKQPDGSTAGDFASPLGQRFLQFILDRPQH